MKWMLIIAVVGLLSVAGFAVAGLVGEDEVIEEELPSCNGGCSVGQTCSNAGCGAKVGKSCGCGE